MKTYTVNYCDRGNTSDLHKADTLEEAVKFADEYVKDYEKLGADIDPDTSKADIFNLQVWSFDEEEYELWEQNDGDYNTEPGPDLEYGTAYYYNRYFYEL